MSQVVCYVGALTTAYDFNEIDITAEPARVEVRRFFRVIISLCRRSFPEEALGFINTRK
jgi:hypothetical protein